MFFEHFAFPPFEVNCHLLKTLYLLIVGALSFLAEFLDDLLDLLFILFLLFLFYQLNLLLLVSLQFRHDRLAPEFVVGRGLFFLSLQLNCEFALHVLFDRVALLPLLLKFLLQALDFLLQFFFITQFLLLPHLFHHVLLSHNFVA